MRIGLNNANSCRGTAGYLRCEKICREVETVLLFFDEIEVIRELQNDECLFLFLRCSEMTTEFTNVIIQRGFSENSNTKILQSAIYHSVNKYAGFKELNQNFSICDDKILKTGKIPSILISTDYSCEETGFELLAQNIARGIGFAVAGFLRLSMKHGLLNSVYYVKPLWDKKCISTDRYYGYESALKRAQLAAANVYNSTGECLAIFGNPPKNKELTCNKTCKITKLKIKLLNFFKSFISHFAKTKKSRPCAKTNK